MVFQIIVLKPVLHELWSEHMKKKKGIVEQLSKHDSHDQNIHDLGFSKPFPFTSAKFIIINIDIRGLS